MKHLLSSITKRVVIPLVAGGILTGWPQSVIAQSNTEIAMTQKKTIQGKVFDSQGEPLIGASVVVKGSNNAVVTDIDGNFRLDNIIVGNTIQVSYVGCKSVEFNVTDKTDYNVTLEENANILNDVVVVGYGTMRKKDLTGSVVQIRPDEVAAEAPRSVQDVLRGTPGLNVGMSTDAKGGGSLQIRGQRSVYNEGSHNSPLIILDGMQFYGELSEINPADIGQIDVLKDASSAAVYGARAANGVIIITTKRGKVGKPTVSLKTDWSFVNMGAKWDVYDAEGYLNYRKDWYEAQTYGVDPYSGNYQAYGSGKWTGKGDDKTWEYAVKPGFYAAPSDLGRYNISVYDWRAMTGASEEMSDAEVWGLRLGMQGQNLQNMVDGQTFDWYKQSFRTGFNQNYNINISGATERVNYYASFGYMKNEGIVRGNDYKTYRSSVKVNGKITDWFELGVNANFQNRTDADYTVDWASQIKRNSPFAQYRDEDGNLERFPMGNVAGEVGYNADWHNQWLTKDAGTTVLNTVFSAKLNLPFGFTYNFNIAPRFQWHHSYSAHSSDDPSVETGSASRSSSRRFDYSLNNTLTWDKTFADIHHFTVTLVQEAEERRSWSHNINANKLLPTDALGYHYVGVADKEASSFGSNDGHETADGLLGRVHYSFNNRYLFTGSVRRDGYSAFGTSNPRATFFSVALGWVFTNEKFFTWEPMNFGKFRFSWGENGNRQLADPDIALANLGFGAGKTYGYIVNGNLTEYKYMTMSRLANSHLKWEKTTAFNIGLDFGFLNNRLSGSIEYYHMPTTQMIMNQRIPQFSGFSSITSNLGEVVNKGMEISLSSINMDYENFRWTTTVGFSFNQNRIKHLYYEYEDVFDDNGNIIGSKESDDISNSWFIGRPIGSIWTYEVTGIWQKDEVEEAAKYGQQPGDPKVWNNPANDVYDDNGNLQKIIYDNEDKKFLGQSTPKFNWSMRNSFTIYKDFGLSFHIYSKMGHKSTSTNYLNNDNTANKIVNGQNVYKKEYWTPEHATNEYGRLQAQGPSGVSSPSKVYDRSFIRLENITFTYNLPNRLIKRIGLEKLMFNASIKNVACWSNNWKYWDPETGGIAPRTYNFGLTATF